MRFCHVCKGPVCKCHYRIGENVASFPFFFILCFSRMIFIDIASVYHVIRNSENHIFHFNVSFVFLRNTFVTNNDSHEITAYCPCRVTISIMIYRRNNSILKTIQMLKGTVKGYCPYLFSNPALTQQSYSFTIFNVFLRKFNRLVRNIPQFAEGFGLFLRSIDIGQS